MISRRSADDLGSLHLRFRHAAYSLVPAEVVDGALATRCRDLEERQDGLDDLGGSVLRNQVTAGHPNVRHVGGPSAPHIDRGDRATSHLFNDKAFVRPEY